MKGTNFLKFLRLFDYFKAAYRINRQHKELYRPQIYLILLRGLLVLLTVFSLFDLTERLIQLGDMAGSNQFMRIFWNEFSGLPLILILATLFILLFGSTYVEAGLYNMYYKLSIQDNDDADFIYGANRYFFPFLFGNIIIGLFWFFAIIPYVLLGLLTLTLGFTLIPLIVGVFLMVWKVALVSEQIGTFPAFGKSFSFGKRHFIPSSLLLMIKGSLSTLSGGGGSGGGGNTGSSWQSNNGDIFNLPSTPGRFRPDPFVETDWMEVLKIIGIAVTSVITVITVVVGLIHMVFDIFFGLVFTQVYLDDWNVTVPESEPTDQQTDTGEVM